MIKKVKLFYLVCLLVIAVYIIFSLVVPTYPSYFYPFYIPCDWSSNCHLENYNLKRTFCSRTKFDDGLVCPTLYAQLGGNCTYTNNTKVMCKDVRTLAAPYTLRQAQLAITRLLASFNIIAKKHGIKYWLTSGTLLGAVRHNGFIPWDNDGDIEMSLEEYERFFRHASYDSPGDIFFQNSESDINLRPSDPEEYIRQKYKDIGLYKTPMNPRLRDVKSCYKYCIQYGCKWHDGLMVDIFVRNNSVPFRTYPLKAVLFEGLRFPIQNNWREVLADKYGKDFMAIPQKASSDVRHQGIYMVDPVHSCEELSKQRLQ